MQVIRTLLCLRNIINIQIRQFLEQRFLAITDGENLDPDIHGYALVIEPGDMLETLLADPEASILKDLVEDSPYVIPPECVEEHRDFFDVVFVPGDGDFGITVVVPKEPGIDPALLSLCAQITTPAPSEMDE